MDSDSEDFVVVGTPPLEREEEDRAYRKKVRDLATTRSLPVHKQVPVDAQGRARFHGAFEGGFSAGYFNTVGSKEGWAPSQFRSSRGDRAAPSARVAEDYMDDDEREALQASRLEARDDYDTFGTAAALKAQRQHSAAAAPDRVKGGGGIIPGPVPSDLVVPVSDPKAQRLLRRMGWRPGKGIGRKHASRPSPLAVDRDHDSDRSDAEDDALRRARRRRPRVRPRSEDEPPRRRLRSFEGAEEFRVIADARRRARDADPRGMGARDPRAARHSAWASSRRRIRRRTRIEADAATRWGHAYEIDDSEPSDDEFDRGVRAHAGASGAVKGLLGDGERANDRGRMGSAGCPDETPVREPRFADSRSRGIRSLRRVGILRRRFLGRSRGDTSSPRARRNPRRESKSWVARRRPPRRPRRPSAGLRLRPRRMPRDDDSSTSPRTSSRRTVLRSRRWRANVSAGMPSLPSYSGVRDRRITRGDWRARRRRLRRARGTPRRGPRLARRRNRPRRDRDRSTPTSARGCWERRRWRRPRRAWENARSLSTAPPPGAPREVPPPPPREPERKSVDVRAIAEGDRSRIRAALSSAFTSGSGDADANGGGAVELKPGLTMPSALPSSAAAAAARAAEEAERDARARLAPIASSRTSEDWAPAALVCKRFDVADPFADGTRARPSETTATFRSDEIVLTETDAAAKAAAPAFLPNADRTEPSEPATERPREKFRRRRFPPARTPRVPSAGGPPSSRLPP